jgi:hypothetical protein
MSLCGQGERHLHRRRRLARTTLTTRTTRTGLVQV